MSIKDLQENWNKLANTDPMWAILTFPGKEKNRWNRDEFFATGVQEIQEAMQKIGSLKFDFPRRQALDFGCGVGRLSQALADYFDHVHGVDIAPAMIDKAREYNSKGSHCTYTVNSVTNLQLFGDNYFDFIYSNITLQHMDRRYIENYIREFVRVLNPQGLLVFQLPSEPSFSPKGLLIRTLPASVLNTLRKMEMHGIPRVEVEALLLSTDAEVIHVANDTSAGSGWDSYRYFCRRKATRKA